MLRLQLPLQHLDHLKFCLWSENNVVIKNIPLLVSRYSV